MSKRNRTAAPAQQTIDTTVEVPTVEAPAPTPELTHLVVAAASWKDTEPNPVTGNLTTVGQTIAFAAETADGGVYIATKALPIDPARAESSLYSPNRGSLTAARVALASLIDPSDRKNVTVTVLLDRYAALDSINGTVSTNRDLVRAFENVRKDYARVVPMSGSTKSSPITHVAQAAAKDAIASGIHGVTRLTAEQYLAVKADMKAARSDDYAVAL